MRLFLSVGAILLLSGCTAIPPAVTLATWAIDGATEALSGKSVPDHAISLVAQQDCGMWRPVAGEPMCNEYVNDEDRVVIAYSEAAGRPTRLALLERSGPASGPDRSESDRAELAGAAAGAEEARAERLAAALADVAPAAGPMSEPGAAATDGAEAAVERVSGDRGEAPVLALAEQAPLAEMRYVVLASFLVPEHASELAVRYEALDPFITQAVVDGRLFRRVIVGPFRSDEAEAVLRRVVAAGAETAWVIPAKAIRRPLSLAQI